jgi:hypothetical protein
MALVSEDEKWYILLTKLYDKQNTVIELCAKGSLIEINRKILGKFFVK